MIHRRHMLLGLGTIGALPISRTFAAEILTLGDATLTTLNDGHLLLPTGFVFDTVNADTAESIRQSYGISDELKPPCNVTLLRVGGRVVLFDCGAGSGFQPDVGLLPEALDAAGVLPEEVTDVIFTHGHPDHLWGILDDFDEPLFANARLRMGREELDYWRDPGTVEAIGETRASFAVGAKRRLDLLGDRIEDFGDGEEVIPGVTARLAAGHTPGHMAFRLSFGGEETLLVGDAIGNHHIAFAAPAIETGNDQDMARAADTRVRLLDEIAADGLMMIGFHLPNGGIGRAERRGTKYRFAPS